jgi:putative inorganic carbon (hco3(-)) transporter
MHLGLEGIVPTSLWLAMVICFLISVFKEPAVGLYLLIPLLPLETIRYKLHGYFLGAQFVDILLLGAILGLKRQGREVICRTPLTGVLLVYLIFTYLSLVRGSFFLDVGLPLWFDDPRVSDWKNFVVDLLLVFLVTVSAIRTKRQMGHMLISMCLGALFLAKGFHNIMGDRDFSAFSYELRDSGPMGGAGVNGLAAFAAQVSVFLTGLCLVERRALARIGYLCVIVASVYCLLFSLSRGGYAALLIGLLFLGFVRNRWLVLGVVGFLLVWQSLVPAAVRERVFMTQENGEIDHSAAARLSLWDEAMRVFEADPAFGTGFDTYKYGSHVGGYGDTHNLFVKVLVETGVCGLLLFFAILYRLFRIGFRLSRTASDPFLRSIGLGFSGLMIAALIGNFFGDRWMYFQITGYTFAFGALAVRAQQITDEQDEAETDEEERGLVELEMAGVSA